MSGPYLLRAIAAALLALAPLAGWTPALAANCTAAEREEANRLWLSPADQQAAIAIHLPWGEPRETAPTDNERLLVQRDHPLRRRPQAADVDRRACR